MGLSKYVTNRPLGKTKKYIATPKERSQLLRDYTAKLQYP